MSDHDRPGMIPAPVDGGSAEPTVPAAQPAHAATRPSVTRPFVRPVRASVLTSRAIAAARARAAVGTPHSSDRAWLDRAGQAVRILAGTLGVDPAAVLARPDPDRRQGLLGAPGVLLYVLTDQTTGPRDGSAGFQGELLFIPEESRSDVFLRLMPCSDCGRFVPTHRVTSLADLGRHLDPESPRWAREPDVPQFHTDPAHRPRCRRRHQTHPSSHDYR